MRRSDRLYSTGICPLAPYSTLCIPFCFTVCCIHIHILYILLLRHTFLPCFSSPCVSQCASDVLPSDAASKHNPSISPDQPPPEDRASGRGASRTSSTVGDASQPKPPPDSEKEVSTVLVPPLEGGEGEEQEGRAKECKPAVFIQEPPQGEEGVTMATSEAALSTSDSTALLKEEEATTAAQEQCPTPSPSPDISIEPVSMIHSICICTVHTVHLRCLHM